MNIAQYVFAGVSLASLPFFAWVLVASYFGRNVPLSEDRIGAHLRKQAH